MRKHVLVSGMTLAMALAAAAGTPIKVGLVTDIGGIDDKSFNQGTWEGLKAYAKENNLKVGDGVKYLQSSAEADYVPNLSTFADEKRDLIVAPGFLFSSALGEVSAPVPQAEVPDHRLGGEGQGREDPGQRRQRGVRRA